ncbi:MAG: flagellin lysine-N-methylase [Pseudobutyrivibrio sp.]|uniref:flagellin lysine-N-methylase n=1 Tax=Pseudobutyrivibrio sp. TaxID=2014367 RepID=UPI0025E8F0A2|nr:flagellin lysine-N-methylase [Pseudobutyrivibrio sp.]MBQ6462926.1 flagellin lysine-N-methylase [Pseudobutyrivibrio sp.]
MLYRKQTGYDEFKCIADKCPKSCCIGWQIVIDEDSVNKYTNTSGNFSDRLKASIDYNEECFKQNNTRCAMLNETGLCDLQSTLGEEYLCNTCRMFPRHFEEFQDIREYSLSLSCPEVTRMIMEPEFVFTISETEDDIEDNPDEFEDFDFMLYDKLEYARDKMFAIAKKTALPLQERMNLIACMSLKLQELYDEGDIFAMDNVTADDNFETTGTSAMLSLDNCLKGFDTLIEMEVLEESWRDSIKEAKAFWLNNTNNFTTWKSAMYPDKDQEFIFEKILESLLYTYFCGAVYDGQIYARTMIAVQSTRWLMMLDAASSQELAKTIYLYSREVEHSDLNVNRLIEYFESELYGFSLIRCVAMYSPHPSAAQTPSPRGGRLFYLSLITPSSPTATLLEMLST